MNISSRLVWIEAGRCVNAGGRNGVRRIKWCGRKRQWQDHGRPHVLRLYEPTAREVTFHVDGEAFSITQLDGNQLRHLRCNA